MDRVPSGQRALQLSDLQLVALVPMEKSNAALVETELEQAMQRTGRPRLVVADQGTDLRKGLADFVASTEILESSFGKLKRLEQQQSQDGITSLVLAGMNEKPCEEQLQHSLGQLRSSRCRLLRARVELNEGDPSVPPPCLPHVPTSRNQ